MSAIVGLKDVASSWINTAKVVGVGAVSVVAYFAIEKLLNETRRHGYLLWTTDNEEQVERASRNDMIIYGSMVATSLAIPALVPLKSVSFSKIQNLQFVLLDALTYLLARHLFRGNEFVDSKFFRMIMLGRSVFGIANQALEVPSKLLIPASLIGFRVAYVTTIGPGGYEGNYIVGRGVLGAQNFSRSCIATGRRLMESVDLEVEENVDPEIEDLED